MTKLGRLRAFTTCRGQLRSGLRAVDLPDDERNRVLSVLRGMTIPDAWTRMVEEVVRTVGADRSDLFGESLPIGLRLAN